MEGRYDYLSEPTKRVLDILDEFNMTATFFIVADVAEHYPGLIESIAARGHEIACHGADHRCSINPNTKKPLLTIEEFEQSTIEQRRYWKRLRTKSNWFPCTERSSNRTNARFA
jgi:peptidoglycan/xylan/chitin deacetylase (PgdA/CDA1 family)